MAMQKILIIDDKVSKSSSIVTLLNKEYEVIFSSSSKDGLSLAKSEVPCLILLDVVISKQDGCEVATQLKDDSITRNIPFIFITDKNDQESIVKGFEYGAVDYISKPFCKQELLARVGTHLNKAYLQKKIVQRNEELQSVLNLQDNIVVLTDGINLKFANKKFFDYFGYKDLSDFNKRHKCICEHFNRNEETFHLGKIKENENWIEVVQTLPASKRIVSVDNKQFQTHTFAITVNCFDSVNRIVTLVDISQTMLEQIKLTTKVKKQDELIKSQSKLAAMGEMIDAIAHQWMHPLTLINLYMDIMSEDKKYGELSDDRIDEYVVKTKEQVKHLVDTLEEFRRFFRPNFHLEEVYLKDIINSVTTLMKDELIKNKIVVDYTNVGDEKVNVVPNEFKHVLINLLSNSKDAFNEKGIKNRTVSFSTQSEKNNIELSVSDNAGGIPNDIIKRVFDAHLTTKKDGKGTGIGLYLSKQIVEKVGATIKVESSSYGTCFVISFSK